LYYAKGKSNGFTTKKDKKAWADSFAGKGLLNTWNDIIIKENLSPSYPGDKVTVIPDKPYQWGYWDKSETRVWGINFGENPDGSTYCNIDRNDFFLEQKDLVDKVRNLVRYSKVKDDFIFYLVFHFRSYWVDTRTKFVATKDFFVYTDDFDYTDRFQVDSICNDIEFQLLKAGAFDTAGDSYIITDFVLEHVRVSKHILKPLKLSSLRKTDPVMKSFTWKGQTI
jgi:hypothetical protein